ncbi:MAG: hypothetical protein LUG95_00275 [Clostridiales bacterium]|nr:hypothetical protein [Clostridiales bacterium]
MSEKANGFNKIAYNNQYNAKNYERISFFVEKGKKEKTKAHADNKGVSMNGYINDAVDEAMNND